MRTILSCMLASIAVYVVSVFVFSNGPFSFSELLKYDAVGLAVGLAAGLLIGRVPASYETDVLDLVEVQKTNFRDKQGNTIVHVWYKNDEHDKHKKFFIVTLGIFTVSEYMGRHDKGVLIPDTKAVFTHGDSSIEIRTAKPNKWAILPKVENKYIIKQPKSPAVQESPEPSVVDELVLA